MKSPVHRALAITVAALAIQAAPAPAGAQPQTQTLIPVKVGVVNSTTEAPLRISAARGYFQDEGLDVTFTTFESATTMTAPLATGQLDVGAAAPAAAFYNAVARNLDVRIVADLGSDPPGYGFESLLIRTDLVKSGRYKTQKDLAGMTIAGVSLGSTLTSQTNELLKKNGLKLSDVKPVYLSFPNHVVALKNGSIDASIMPEPNASFAVQSGVAVRVAQNDEWYPSQQVSTLLYGSSFIKDRRDIGIRFMRAYLRGVRYYNGALAKGKFAGPNAQDVIKVLVDSTTVKDPGVYANLTPNGNNPNGHVNLASMRTDLAFFKDMGLIEGKVSVEDAVDDSFVTDTLKQIGLYSGKSR